MKAKTYSKEQHTISLDQIDHHAYYVIQKLKEAGHLAYLVGGGVRDLLLNTRPKDFDISTSAKPEEIKKLFRRCILIGRRFRLAHVRFGRKILEVSTFRSGDNAAEEIILRDNEWGTAEEDALRRDFTINGLFYDPEDEVIIDYIGGFEDIQKKTLRTIGKPDLRFKQDPVRMIRLIKFISRFPLQIEKETLNALKEHKEEILKSSSTRILEELLRMLESGSSKPFFENLHRYGLLTSLLPQLAQHVDRSSSILDYLDHLDNEMRKIPIYQVNRSLCIATTIYPLFEEGLNLLTLREKKNLNVQVAAHLAHLLLNAVFSPIFQISKKIKKNVIFLLCNQYRFTPLEKELPSKLKIPKDPMIEDAMHLFKIRTKIQPDLLKTYTLWSESIFKSHKKKKKRYAQKRPLS